MSNYTLHSTITIGMVVFWNDPDQGIASGLYRVSNIASEDGRLDADTRVNLVGLEANEIEVPLSELSDAKDYSFNGSAWDLAWNLARILRSTVGLIDFASADGRAFNGDNANEWSGIKPFAEALLEHTQQKYRSDQQASADRQASDLIIDGVKRSMYVEKMWSGSKLQFAVQELGAWLEEAKSFEYTGKAADLLQTGIDAAQAVIDNWVNGLSDAVNALVDWHEGAVDLLEQLQLLPTTPAVVVEISGGNCQGATTRGNVEVFIVDYDNGRDDPDFHPEIPGEDGGPASIWDTGGCDTKPNFVTVVEAISSANRD